MDSPVYAGFFRRWVAFTIDMTIGFLLLALLMSTLGRVSFETVDRNQSAYNGLMWFMLFLSVLYGAVMESSPLQGTLGKLILGIRVTNAEGGRMSFLNALGRSGIKIGSVLFMGIGCLVALFTQKRQALHDLPAHSMVVRKKASKACRSDAAPNPPAAAVAPPPARQAPQSAAAGWGTVICPWDTRGAAVQNILPQELPEIMAEFQRVLYSQLAAAGLPMNNAGSANRIHIIGHYVLLDGGKRALRYFTSGIAGKARLEAEGAVILNGVRLALLHAKCETGLAFQVFGGENKRMLKLSAANCAGQISRQAVQALAALRRALPA